MADDVMLRECPVCHQHTAARDVLESVHPEDNGRCQYAIYCTGCHHRTDWYASRAASIAAWNARVSDPRIAALEAELAAVKARRCETCRSWRGAIDADGWRTCKRLHTPMPPDARCDKWQGEET